MTKYNTGFAKKDNGGNMVFGPVPLKVVTHHHDEGTDIETGEPWTFDWDTEETKLFPTAADYRAAGYKPVVSTPPSGDAGEGRHWVENGYEESEDVWTRLYVEEDDPMPTLSDYDAAMEAHLLAEREARGYTTREPDAYLKSSVPRWRQDAEDWVAHRDAVMSYALSLMNAVAAGQEPPTLAEFRTALPRIEWTYAEDA